MAFLKLSLEILHLVCGNLDDFGTFTDGYDIDDQNHGGNNSEQGVEENADDSVFRIGERLVSMRKRYDGKRALRGMCLASKSLRQIAEPYLYRFIDASAQHICRCLPNLLRNPHLAEHVRGLHIHLDERNPQWTALAPNLRFDAAATALRGVLYDAALVSRKFPNYLTRHVPLQESSLQQEIAAQAASARISQNLDSTALATFAPELRYRIWTRHVAESARSTCH